MADSVLQILNKKPVANPQIQNQKPIANPQTQNQTPIADPQIQNQKQEVLKFTTRRSAPFREHGKVQDLIWPANPDYNNPIVAILN